MLGEPLDLIVHPLHGPETGLVANARVTVDCTAIADDGRMRPVGAARSTFHAFAWETELVWALVNLMVKEFGRSAANDGEVAEALRTALANLDRLVAK